ncbi:hypothetical protein Hypma_007156, partial [Hypsizygus marmoreus]
SEKPEARGSHVSSQGECGVSVRFVDLCLHSGRITKEHHIRYQKNSRRRLDSGVDEVVAYLALQRALIPFVSSSILDAVQTKDLQKLPNRSVIESEKPGGRQVRCSDEDSKTTRLAGVRLWLEATHDAHQKFVNPLTGSEIGAQRSAQIEAIAVGSISIKRHALQMVGLQLIIEVSF